MAQDVRPYKSKEQDGQGNEIILRDQQLVEQGNATTMPSGACFETLDVDNRPVKIPRDNMMNIVLECIGIILNDSSKNLGTNVQKALGLQGNTIGHSTVADFASVLGVTSKPFTAKTITSGSWDDLTTPGCYWIYNNELSNRPSDDFCFLFVCKNTNMAAVYTFIHQIAIRDEANKIYMRKKQNTTWGEWKTIVFT